MRHQTVSSLFDQLFADPLQRPAAAAPVFRPAIDVREDEEGYELVADVPGVGKDDVEIRFEDGVLELKGERPDGGDEEARWFRRERQAGTFVRRIAFRDEIDVDAIDATVRDGVLRVRLPKAAGSKPRQIPVTVH